MKTNKKSIAIFLLLTVTGVLYLWFASVPYQEEILIPKNTEIANVINGKFINVDEANIEGIRIGMNEFLDSFEGEEITVYIKQSQWNFVNIYYQTKDKNYFTKKEKFTLTGDYKIVYDESSPEKLILQCERSVWFWIFLVAWTVISAIIAAEATRERERT